ncbi:MAG: LacI family DNA-binding transcriptional regulator [Fimbriimonadaceae bacterium]|nr:LacI family DNA-binding transcriptional regulator [Fimbriimonadaceae bacterium]
MVSIKDVAALAGVSDRTVSRVASGDTRLLRPATRIKVLNAIEALGYVPNRAAQLMRTSKSMVIGLMTDVVATTPFSTEIVRGIQEALEPTPYQLLSVNTSGDPVKEARTWQVFREHGISGVLYVTMYHRHVSPNAQFPATPVVLVNCSAPERPDLPFIVPDDYAGSYAATAHLIEAGHRQLAYVALNEHVLAADLRGRAFRDALKSAKLEVREDWLVPGLVGEVFRDRFTAFEEVTKLLRRSDRPTGIVCGNDQIALQVYCAVLELGLKVPEDVSIVGFDDFSAISGVLEPKLTTMALPYAEMGALAVETLVGLLSNEQPKTPHTKYACRLIERRSVAKPKA